MEDRLPRKLAAILYADVAGYSRLTGADEDGTHRLLRDHLELISSSIESHNGRVVHYAGDAVLADFDTVIDAVSCAIYIQGELKRRNQALPEERRVQFRIGVNLGDVIVDQEEIYGDGVNVAARLQGLAEPGGVCISDAVRVALGNRLPLTYHDLGQQHVKNISQPIRAWQWSDNDGSPTPAPHHQTKNTDEAYSPKIAVLPFENLTGGPDMDGFANGLTDELITAFSRQTGMKVLSRRSTLPIKDKFDGGKLGQELGVHYLLEGSVRQNGKRVRVAARLMDADTGNDLWGEQYDGNVDDVFALQDEVRLSIVAAVRSQIHVKDAYRVRDLPENELTEGELLALASQRMQTLGLENCQDAARLLRIVIERSPANPMALAMSASCVLLENEYDYKPIARSETERAFKLVDKSIQINEESDYAHYVRGKLLLQVRRQHELAIEEAERALELNPNYTYGYALLGYATICRGDPKRGISLIEKVLRADPRRAGNADFYPLIAVGCFLLEEYTDAIQWVEKAAQRKGYTPQFCVALASYHALAGQADAARTYVNTGIQLAPEATIHNLHIPPLRSVDDKERFLDGLRKAGWTDKQ